MARRVKAFWHANEWPAAKTDWRTCRANFGDRLTPWLLAKIGVKAEWSPLRASEFIGAGSVLQRASGFRGTIWGAGLIEDKTVDLSAANVLALRGPMSGEAPLYADPGLLVEADLEPEFPVGVLSHYIDPLPDKGHRIDVLAPIPEVIKETAKCERVVSNSLHGLILADALGLPNRWVYSPKVLGGGFKFEDYAASFDQTISPGEWRLAPEDQIRVKRTAMWEALGGYCLSAAI